METKEKDLGGRPRKWDDPELLMEAIQHYFQNTSPPYEVSGLCYHLGITRETLRQYQKEDRFSDAIKLAKTKIESDLARRGLSGDNNGTVTIFLLKNNHGYEDTYDHTVKQGKVVKVSKAQAAEILSDEE